MKEFMKTIRARITMPSDYSPPYYRYNPETKTCLRVFYPVQQIQNNPLIHRIPVICPGNIFPVLCERHPEYI